MDFGFWSLVFRFYLTTKLNLFLGGLHSRFVSGSYQWEVLERYILNCIYRVIYALFQLCNKYIILPTFSERCLRSLENQTRKRFTGAIGKVDDIDIVLLYKPGSDLIGKYYYTKKNQNFLNLCVVYNSSKMFIYAITGYSGATYDRQV